MVLPIVWAIVNCTASLDATTP